MTPRRLQDARRSASRIAARVLGDDRRSARDVALPLDGPGSSYRLRLRSLTGARSTQVPILDNGAVAFRVEIPCQGDEPIALDLTWDAQHGLLVDAPGKRALRLPADDRYGPPAPLHPIAGKALDVCFVIDGTALSPVGKGETRELRPLLELSSTWRDDYIERLAAFSEALRGPFPDLWMSVLAFGDEQPEEAEAENLKPKYLLFPEHLLSPDRRSRIYVSPWSRNQLVAALQAIPPTAGGDFVDALGTALHACENIEWRPETRRVIVVSGDSPGFSTAHPAPAYADSHVRRHDVDAIAARLHAADVEIMTIYHRPAQSAAYEIDDPGPFLRFAQEQFTRLASYPALSFELAEFDGARAAAALGAPPPAVARTTALGVAVDL